MSVERKKDNIAQRSSSKQLISNLKYLFYCLKKMALKNVSFIRQGNNKYTD